MRFYKKFILIMLSVFIFVSAYFFTAMYIYDPLQIFHSSWRENKTFVDDMRQQALGIIKHYDFNAVILGNSMLENTSSVEASKLLGDKFINLSSSGLSYFERYKILNFALENKKIEKAILVLDSNFDGGHSQGFKSESYSNDIIMQSSLYFNTRYAACIIAFSNSEKCIGRKVNMDMPNNWMAGHKNLFGGFENIVKDMSVDDKKDLLIEIQSDNHRYDNSKINRNLEVLNNNLVSLIAKFPDTNFYIIIPPYSLLNWKADIDKGASFDEYKRTVFELLHKLKLYDNVKFFWFYNYKFVEDIANYKDFTHYDEKINSLFIEAIKANTNIVDADNISKQFEILEQKIKNYDLKYFIDILKN